MALTLHDPSHLPVEGDRRTRSPVEDHDPHRRGVDQRLQVGLGLAEGLHFQVLVIVPVHLSPLYWAALIGGSRAIIPGLTLISYRFHGNVLNISRPPNIHPVECTSPFIGKPSLVL